MSASAQHYAQRRAEITARIDRDRIAVADAYASIEGQMKVAMAVADVMRTAKKHRVLTALLVVAAIVAPSAARTWLRRAAWLIPVAIEGIRIVRTTRDRDLDER